jgi:hypothetical protein
MNHAKHHTAYSTWRLLSVTSDIILHVRGLVGPSKRVVRMVECILFIPYIEGRRGCFQTQLQS